LTRITGTLLGDLNIFMIISRSFLLRIRNVTDKICRENQDNVFVFYNFFLKSCRLWDNVEKYCKAVHATYHNMAQAHCTLDNQYYRRTHKEYVILTVFPLQQRLRERASMIRHTYIPIGVGLHKVASFCKPSLRDQTTNCPNSPSTTLPRLSTASHLLHSFSVNMSRCLSAAPDQLVRRQNTFCTATTSFRWLSSQSQISPLQTKWSSSLSNAPSFPKENSSLEVGGGNPRTCDSGSAIKS
jgi:hypothetical protein